MRAPAQLPRHSDRTLAPCGSSGFRVCHYAMHLQTREYLQFIDLTDAILTFVTESGIQNGIVNIQTRHTTTAVIVNEHEPLLLEDIKDMLERIAPKHVSYRHNNFEKRTVNMTPDESPNGHAHCQSVLLSSSATLNLLAGEMLLGRWQRIFFIELDHARQRTVSVTVMGQACASE
jgi:secondary thiamine-phosphate synthase enzyme